MSVSPTLQQHHNTHIIITVLNLTSNSNWILLSKKDMFSAQLLNGWLHFFLEHNLSFTHAGILSNFTSHFLWKNKKNMKKVRACEWRFTMFRVTSLQYLFVIWLLNTFGYSEEKHSTAHPTFHFVSRWPTYFEAPSQCQRSIWEILALTKSDKSEGGF